MGYSAPGSAKAAAGTDHGKATDAAARAGGSLGGATGLNQYTGKKPKNTYTTPGPIDEVTQNLNLDKEQRRQQAPFVRAFTTILGALPIAPAMGPAITAGSLMGDLANDALRDENAKHPGTVKVDKNVPGSVYGRINGMMNSTRADVPGYHDGLGSQSSSDQITTATEQEKKRRAQALANATVLGGASGTLGTATNPAPIS